MGIVHVPRRFADLFPPMGPRTLRRVPEGFVVQPYERFVIRPLGPTLGAEIAGVDLSKPLTEDVEADLQRAFTGNCRSSEPQPSMSISSTNLPDISERASMIASWANYRNSQGMVRCHMWERRLAGRNRITGMRTPPSGLSLLGPRCCGYRRLGCEPSSWTWPPPTTTFPMRSRPASRA